MKKIIGFLIALLILLPSVAAFSAGTCVVGNQFPTYLAGQPTSLVAVKVSCTADAADGSYPSDTVIGGGGTISEKIGGFLTAVKFVPGTVTVPTNLMDIVLNDSDSFDVLGGNGVDFVNSAPSRRLPKDSDGNYIMVEIPSDLTIVPTGNSVNSATFDLYLYFIP